jgi:NADH-quinone oxidoreductase subunit L
MPHNSSFITHNSSLKKTMSHLLQLFIIVPIIGFFISLLVPKKQEKTLSNLVLATVGVHLLGTFGFIIYWAINQFPTLDIKHIVLYKSADFEFFIDFYFDKITAVYALVGSILIFLVAVFSRFYMHRDEGFKRFFNTLLFFFIGYNMVVFSGNFETLFVGWEILGLTSFLLIAFYRDRYLPVKNAYKVISFFRLSDICLILAMWMGHHLWHKNITFFELNYPDLVQEQLHIHTSSSFFVALMIVIAAAIKSAQMPFSTWLPRAMEGPTTSSAVFYGSLSVHIGVFLLLRTSALWENNVFIQILIIAIGLCTSVIATTIARVQPTVKTQIAYASITQIGLMFIEIGLGFHTLALVHFAGNAFLRTYQLLVSPSVLSYLTHDMFFNFKPQKAVFDGSFLNKIRNSLYMLGIKEWHFDGFLRRVLWSPFKWVGTKLGFMRNNISLVLSGLLLAVGIAALLTESEIPADFHAYITLFFSVLALFLILKAFTERGDARRAWMMLQFSQFFIAVSVLFNEHFEWLEIGLYLSGSIVAAAVGYYALNKIKAIDGNIDLDQYHGYSYEQPRWGFIFLLSGLGVLGFPITPTFIGIDLMFTHIHANQITLIIVMALNFLFLELSILRIYSRVFLGQHKKVYHPIAYKSS